jgi:two-component system copper resistance phosphate regulon response regulator CusR
LLAKKAPVNFSVLEFIFPPARAGYVLRIRDAVLSPSFNSGSPDILVAEDERKTRESLVEGLSMEQWRVTSVATGNEAIHALDEQSFDLMILDWMLPGPDGLQVLQYARSRGIHTPVLILTARGDVGDRVAGLETGADDYLVKPFAFEELLARSRALLRRGVMATGRYLRCEDLQLDTRGRVAFRDGVEISLTQREVDLLEYLLCHQGEVVTREMLEQEVWKQQRRFTSLDNVIDVQMMRLRRKIDGEGAEKLLHTLRGVGYCLGKGPS